MPNQAFVGRQEIVGRDEIVGASLKSVASAPLKLAKKVATLPIDAAEWALRRAPVPNKSWFIGLEEILGADDSELVALMNRKLTESKDDSDVVRSYVLAIASDPKRMANLNRLAAANNSKAKILLGLIQRAGRPQVMSVTSLGDFVGDEARTLAEDSKSSREADKRIASCGYNSHWNFIRGDGPGITAADIAKVQKLAEGGNKKAKRLLARISKLSKSDAAGDAGPKPDAASERRQAKQILTAASESKAISRDALRRAIWLYAGAASTEAERTSVGRKMLALLNDNKVRLTN